MKKRLAYLVLATGLTLGLSAAIQSYCFAASFSNEDIEVQISIASSSEQRIQGLMEHAPLSPDEGLLLIFDESTPIYLWAKNVCQNLDIAFLDDKGSILSIQCLKCHLELNEELKNNPENEQRINHKFLKEQIRGPKGALYALEMAYGFFKRHGIHEGDSIVWQTNSVAISKIHILRQKVS